MRKLAVVNMSWSVAVSASELLPTTVHVAKFSATSSAWLGPESTAMGLFGRASEMMALMRVPVPRSMPFEHDTSGVCAGIPISASFMEVSLVAEVGMTKRMTSASEASDS